MRAIADIGSLSDQLPNDVVWSSDKSHLGYWAFDGMTLFALIRMRQPGPRQLPNARTYWIQAEVLFCREIEQDALAVELLIEHVGARFDGRYPEVGHTL